MVQTHDHTIKLTLFRCGVHLMCIPEDERERIHELKEAFCCCGYSRDWKDQMKKVVYTTRTYITHIPTFACMREVHILTRTSEQTGQVEKEKNDNDENGKAEEKVACTHTNTSAHTHTHTHKNAHTQTHTHTHEHAHTHHAHECEPCSRRWPLVTATLAAR